jgi:hypothetical protein
MIWTTMEPFIDAAVSWVEQYVIDWLQQNMGL